MRVKVIAPDDVALKSRRQPTQWMEVGLDTTIQTLKIQITMIYTQLDPDSFDIYFNGQLCTAQLTMLSLKTKFNPIQMHFLVRLKSGCCLII